MAAEYACSPWNFPQEYDIFEETHTDRQTVVSLTLSLVRLRCVHRKIVSIIKTVNCDAAEEIKSETEIEKGR